MTWAAAARTAALAALRGCRTQALESSMVQTRRMGGGGGPGIPYHRSFDGSPPPASMMGPEFVTYAGLTLPKPKKDLDYYTTKVVGAVVWFTIIYHVNIDWGELWDGDIWTFEKDVQTNGWDDDGHGHH